MARLMRMHRYGLSRSSVSTGCHYVVVALTNSIISLQQLTFFPFPAASAYAMAEASWRNVSPRLITTHAILAILLATAIVTTRAGRL